MIKKYKIWTGLLILALAGVAVPGCTQTSRSSSPSAIDVNVLQEMMTSEKVTLVNVSGPLSCMDSRIPGSLCLSCDEKINSTVFSAWRKDSKIVFYNGSPAVDPHCPLIAETLKQGITDVSLLTGGLPAWRLAGKGVEAQNRIPRIFSYAVNPQNLAVWRKQAKNPLVIDIRSPKSYAAGHLDASRNIPLTELQVRYADIPLDRTLLIVDEDGSESLLAASYLARKGFLNIQRLKGGMIGLRRGAP